MFKNGHGVTRAMFNPAAVNRCKKNTISYVEFVISQDFIGPLAGPLQVIILQLLTTLLTYAAVNTDNNSHYVLTT